MNVIYYATKGTFDTYRWQLLEKKQETASKVLSGKPVSRSCKDIDEVALTFSEMKAATTDNPLVAEKLTVDNEVARLSLLETEYLSHHRQLAHDIQEVYPKNIQSFTRQRENTIIDIQTLNSNPYIDECFRIEFDGRMITEKEKAAAEFESKARAYMIGEAFRGGEPVFFAKYHGFEIGLRRSDQYSCSILVKGANLYKSDYNNSGTGAITRIDNMLERLAKQHLMIRIFLFQTSPMFISGRTPISIKSPNTKTELSVSSTPVPWKSCRNMNISMKKPLPRTSDHALFRR